MDANLLAEVSAKINGLCGRLYNEYKPAEQARYRDSVVAYMEGLTTDSIAVRRFVSRYRAGKYKIVILDTAEEVGKVYEALLGNTEQTATAFAFGATFPWIVCAKDLEMGFLASILIHEATHIDGYGEFRAWSRQAQFLRNNGIAFPEEGYLPLKVYCSQRGPGRAGRFATALAATGYNTEKIVHRRAGDHDSRMRSMPAVRKALGQAVAFRRLYNADKRAQRKLKAELNSILGGLGSILG